MPSGSDMHVRQGEPQIAGGGNSTCSPGGKALRPKAQVFMLRYAAPRPSNSKLNAAIQAGSTRYDIPIRSRKNLNLATAKLTYG